MSDTFASLSTLSTRGLFWFLRENWSCDKYRMTTGPLHNLLPLLLFEGSQTCKRINKLECRNKPEVSTLTLPHVYRFSVSNIRIKQCKSEYIKLYCYVLGMSSVHLDSIYPSLTIRKCFLKKFYL